jgi:hypothetical protein
VMMINNESTGASHDTPILRLGSVGTIVSH